MKWRPLVYLLAVVLTLPACQLVTNLASRGGSPTKSAKDYQYIFKPPANPIKLGLTLDATHAATATLSVQGGQLSATGADGTLYTLVIPAQALVAATPITLTPVASVTGLPFSGQPLYAVQLAPEGLYLYSDAILTITPTKPISLAQQLFLDYQADGKNVGLAIPVVDSPALKIRLLHFSGYGVTDGTPADEAAVQGQLGGDAEAALQSLTAEVVAQMRENQQTGIAVDETQQEQVIVNLIDQWGETVVKPALAAAGDSCAAGKDAIRKVLGMERMKQLLGVPGTALGSDLEALIATAAKQCAKEEYQRCVDEHTINRMIPFYLGLMRQHQLLGGASGSPEPEELILARDLMVKCLTFELQFHSQGTFDTGDGGYQSVVEGKLTLRLDPTSLTLSGSGPLEDLSFEFHMPKGGKGTTCTAQSQPGGGTFEVKSLAYVEDTRSETDPQPYVRDFKLIYFPGVTSESYHIHCIYTDSQGKKTTQDFTSPPSGYWTGIFFTLHSEELVGAVPAGGGSMPPVDLSGAQLGALPAFPAPAMPPDGGFFVNEWDLTPGDALMASKEWIKTSSAVPITESGTLKLYHRPGS